MSDASLSVTAFWCPNDCLHLRFVARSGLKEYMENLAIRLMKKGFAVLFIPATKYVSGAPDESHCVQREFSSVYACKSLKGCTSIDMEDIKNIIGPLVNAKHVGAVLTDMKNYVSVFEKWFGPYDQNKAIIDASHPLHSDWELWFDSKRIRNSFYLDNSGSWEGLMFVMAPKAGGEEHSKKRKKKK